jgi:multidrug efflux pump subunit AcrA (membrane-fusion protein)
MSSNWAERLKKFLIIPAILLGIAVFAYRMKGKEPPQQKENTEETRIVRVVSVPSLTVVPRALGYGNVRPGMVWKAVAEVSGKIVEVHPRLRKGAILPAGTVLLRIDPTDYQLAVAQIKANIRSAKAEMEELRVKELNTRASLKIEARALSLNEKELKRKRELLKKGSITTQSAVDQEERNVLRQQQTVQNLKNSRNLIPAEREVLNAKVAQLQAQLEEAERKLKRTTITAPFDCRIAEFDSTLPRARCSLWPTASMSLRCRRKSRWIRCDVWWRSSAAGPSRFQR